LKFHSFKKKNGLWEGGREGEFKKKKKIDKLFTEIGKKYLIY